MICFFLGIDDPRGGRRFDSYAELGPFVALLPSVNCP